MTNMHESVRIIYVHCIMHMHACILYWCAEGGISSDGMILKKRADGKFYLVDLLENPDIQGIAWACILMYLQKRSWIFDAYISLGAYFIIIIHVHGLINAHALSHWFCRKHSVSSSLWRCDPLLWIQGRSSSLCSLLEYVHVSMKSLEETTSSVVWLLSIQCYNCPS